MRFQIGDRVECRIGPHPVKGWAPGRIVDLHYAEPNWPPNMEAPYQIALDDGRLIFAPQDTDAVIRLLVSEDEGDVGDDELVVQDQKEESNVKKNKR